MVISVTAHNCNQLYPDTQRKILWVICYFYWYQLYRNIQVSSTFISSKY